MRHCGLATKRDGTIEELSIECGKQGLCSKRRRFWTQTLGDRYSQREGYIMASKDDTHPDQNPALAGDGSGDTPDDGQIHEGFLQTELFAPQQVSY